MASHFLLPVDLQVHAFNPIKSAQEIFPHHSFVNITLEDHQLNRSNIQQFFIVVHRHDERVREHTVFSVIHTWTQFCLPKNQPLFCRIGQL